MGDNSGPRRGAGAGDQSVDVELLVGALGAR